MKADRRMLLKSAVGIGGAGLLPSSAGAQSFLPGIQNVGVKANTGAQRTESGVGALMPWADKLWAVTYVSSSPGSKGPGVGLYEIDENLNIEQRHVSNGVCANRLIHHESTQLFIGPYVIDMNGNVRIIDGLLKHRLTATMKHLTDPANRVYMLTMEGSVYEVDVSTLKVTRLFDLRKELNDKRVHYKGGFTGAGRMIVANNSSADPFHGYSPGLLAEFDGERWNILDRNPHMEVAGRYDLGHTVFATGWDDASALFWFLANGTWHKHRLPKGSHTFDHAITTEWTRIREVETERFLMDCHGMFYELAPMAYDDAVWGVKPICQHLRVIPDFCSFRGLFVMGGNQSTPNKDTNPVVGQPQSGIWFGKTDDLWQFGKPQGWGGPWRGTPVEAGQPSDPYLMTGFDKKMLHLNQEGAPSTAFTIEVDFLGNGGWQKYETIKVGNGEYGYHVFPEGFSAHWVRVTSSANCTATAQFVYT